jgi:hypothetical protein
MVETVRRAEYFYVIVEDKPGEGRKLLEFFGVRGVNMLNFTAFPVGDGRAQLDFFPEKVHELERAAEQAGISLVGPKKAFLIQGQDRLGVLAEYHARLADAGVNVYAANGTTDGRGGFGYVLWVKPKDYERAAKALGV